MLGGGRDRQTQRKKEREKATDKLIKRQKKRSEGGKQKLDRTERKRNKSASELL